MGRDILLETKQRKNGMLKCQGRGVGGNDWSERSKSDFKNEIKKEISEETQWNVLRGLAYWMLSRVFIPGVDISASIVCVFMYTHQIVP